MVKILRKYVSSASFFVLSIQNGLKSSDDFGCTCVMKSPDCPLRLINFAIISLFQTKENNKLHPMFAGLGAPSSSKKFATGAFARVTRDLIISVGESSVWAPIHGILTWNEHHHHLGRH